MGRGDTSAGARRSASPAARGQTLRHRPKKSTHSVIKHNYSEHTRLCAPSRSQRTPRTAPSEEKKWRATNHHHPLAPVSRHRPAPKQRLRATNNHKYHTEERWRAQTPQRRAYNTVAWRRALGTQGMARIFTSAPQISLALLRRQMTVAVQKTVQEVSSRNEFACQQVTPPSTQVGARVEPDRRRSSKE